MSNEQKQPQEGKPLTAEDFIQLNAWPVTGDEIHQAMEKYADYKAAQQTAALREELERSKDRVDYFREAADKKDVTIENIEKKLESQKKKFKSALADRDQIMRQLYKNESAKLKEELEAVKKENEEWKARNLEYSYQVALKSCVLLQDQLSEVTRQRDEANELLREFRSRATQGNIQDLVDFDEKVQLHLSRLSSGETKPSSPWISVEERLPEEGQSVAFVVASTVDEHNNGRVLGGLYDGFKFGYHGFSTPGVGWAGSHWMPLPAPPEYLTDKK